MTYLLFSLQPPMDPSHQAPIVRDNFGQVQHDQGQGQQIHMEQRPPGDGQPIYNQVSTVSCFPAMNLVEFL